jgi:hypothetical protein
MLAQIIQLAADTDLEDSESVLELAPLAVTVILGTLIPLLTGILTKLEASAKLKGFVTLTLAAVAGVVTQAVTDNGGAIFSDETLILAGLAWVQSVASYLGLWQSLAVNAKLAPDQGLG